MRLLSWTVAAACALASWPAAAQTLKPGLWEMQHKRHGDAQMEERIAHMRKEIDAMPPEQRKQAEAMMARRGMRIAPGAGGATSMRICLTREMVERNEIVIPRKDCQSKQRRSGNTAHVSYSCTAPRSSGDMQITIHGAESYSIHSVITSETDGKPQTETIDGDGKWLSADCGDVKPIQASR